MICLSHACHPSITISALNSHVKMPSVGLSAKPLQDPLFSGRDGMSEHVHAKQKQAGRLTELSDNASCSLERALRILIQRPVCILQLLCCQHVFLSCEHARPLLNPPTQGVLRWTRQHPANTVDADLCKLAYV